MFYQFPEHVNAGIAANVRISVGVFLRNETYCSKVCIQVWLVVLSPIVPDEVFVGNAKRVGENKRVMQLLVFRSEARWFILEKKYNVV